MPIFKSKDRTGNRSVNFSHVDGLPGYVPNEAVNATLSNDASALVVKSRIAKRPEIKLSFEKITSVSVASETEIQEKSKSVIGRAAIGVLLLGPLGGMIGGMSGIGAKRTKEEKSFILITYLSSDKSEKTIVLEIVGASVGWNKFVSELKEINQTEDPEEIIL